MLNRPIVAIDLTPVSLDVFVVGRESSRVHVELDRTAWDNSWSGGLRALDEPLRAALRRLGVGAKARAVVVYPGPDAAADLISVRSSGSEAISAARLALRESGLDIGGPMAARVFDHRGSGRDVETRVFAVGDTSTAAECIADWTRRAGLRLIGMTSVRASVLAAAMRRCESLSSGDHVVVELHEHATGVVGISRGRVAFARVLSFGFDLLLEAIGRGARDVTKGREQPLTRQELREMLFSCGVPGRNSVLHECLGLRGEHVLPLMHPVIQRFAVEIRQTLRFAKMEGSGDSQNVVLAGPGAAIKGIEAVFGEFVDAPVSSLCPEGGESSLACAVAATGLDSGLLYAPESEMNARGQRLVRRGVQGGALVAAMLLAAFAGDAVHQLRTQQSRLKLLSPEVARIEQLRNERSDLAAQIKLVKNAETTLHQAVGERYCWAAGLADMSRLVPSGVTLVEVTGLVEAKGADRDGGPVLSLKGYSPLAANEAQSDPADAFAEGLRRSAVLTGVEFSSSRVLQSDDGGTRQFILSARPLKVSGNLAMGVSQ